MKNTITNKLDENFELTNNQNHAFITMRGFICMYAGDRGSEVWTEQELTKDELKALIVRLIKIWRKI